VAKLLQAAQRADPFAEVAERRPGWQGDFVVHKLATPLALTAMGMPLSGQVPLHLRTRQ